VGRAGPAVVDGPLDAKPALLRLRSARAEALLSTCLKTYSGESQMKRQRPPYASRSVWLVIAALAVVLVVGGAAAGYEINHLRTQVDGLGTQVHELQSQVALIYRLLVQTIQGLK
jgi:hypothetical protein